MELSDSFGAEVGDLNQLSSLVRDKRFISWHILVKLKLSNVTYLLIVNYWADMELKLCFTSNKSIPRLVTK